MTYSEKLRDPHLQLRSGIYRLNINDGFYVGSAVRLTKRLGKHLSDLRARRHHNAHLQRAFDKYSSIDFEILEIVEDAAILIKREQFYIDTLKPNYNISATAGSQLGFRHSAESRALISRVQIGRIIPPDIRQKMSESKKGVKLTRKHRENISASKMDDKNPWYKAGQKHPQFGKTKTSETRNRISTTSRARGSHKGANNAASRSGVLYDVLTGKNYIFLSLKPLCENLGLSYKRIHLALSVGRFSSERYYASYVALPEGHPGTTIFNASESE